MQPRQDLGSPKVLARPRDARPTSMGMMQTTARLYPSALSAGGWYLMTPDASADVAVYAPPPGHMLTILEELLTGDTDVTMSRRLSMSPRTFSRRVAELLDYLRVNTRFQAGLEAALRGWVPLSACSPAIREVITAQSRRIQAALR